ncbi:alpha/beta hydrolase [Pseudomonas wadenswilerensis]|uniref:Putative alpha/beta hydrolase n=1 Tax=Pseudomonas wadenswilerensis TaxID=1785161 RepID=A0A380SZI8_9PSED|nr:alpha/beta hydrolase [Pseudomonas wadenswilerensis]SUQ62646.1 putative alpha/beta hydrolase [Pseudomonas wadenswilerensis]
MHVHPDLAAFLELAELGRLTGSNRPLHELPVTQAREVFEQASAVLDPTPPALLTVSELTLPARDGVLLPARLYRRPGSDSKPLPVLFYLHGGGYVVGSLDSHDSVCRRLAASGCFAVFAPSYRRAPEHGFPVPLNDTLDAANWLATQAAALQLDSQQVIFIGDSVGASLASVLSLTAVHHRDQLNLAPRAQMLLYPVTDLSRERDSHRTYAEGYLLETATLRWFYRQYLGAHGSATDWRVSPLLHPDPRGLPPTYLAVAGFDPLHDEGLAYAQALEQAGVALTLRRVEDMTHDYLRMSGMVADVEAIYAELENWALNQLG